MPAQHTPDIAACMPVVGAHVRALAVRLPAQAPIERDDLFSAGTLGLLDAARRYRPGQGGSFANYASERVRGAMLDALRATDWAPRSLRRQTRAIDAAAGRLRRSLARRPRAAEIAAVLDITLADYHRARDARDRTRIESYRDENGPDGPASNVAAEARPDNDPCDAVIAFDAHQRLQAAIARLPARQRHVMQMYYGRGRVLRVIGDTIGVSESRACQIHGQAIGTLRREMAA